LKNTVQKILFGLSILICIKTSGSSPDTLPVFSPDTIHEIRIIFHQDDFKDSLLKNYQIYHDSDVAGRDLMLADVIIDNVHIDSVGVKYKSNFSFSIPNNKKPLKIDFNAFVKGRLFQGLRAINLSNEFPDPSMLRNTVAYKILRSAGVKAPHTSFARVYINDRFYGLYVIIEQVDKSFIKQNFVHQGGEIIKALAASLSWYDDDTISFRNNYEIKSRNNEQSMQSLERFARKINSTAAPQFYDSLKNYFDFDSYLPVFAADVIFNNWDSYFYGQNYYLYRDTVVNKYYFLPWDYNVSMNNYDVSGGDFTIVPGGKNLDFFDLPLPSRVLENKILREKYLNEVCRINKIMGSDSLRNFILSNHKLISAAMKEDYGKVMTNLQFEKSLSGRIAISEIEFEGLMSFINYRKLQVQSMLQTEGINCK
jgi:spore coat protein CotH